MAITSEELKSIPDVKLSPLHSEITNLKEQLRETNSILEFVSCVFGTCNVILPFLLFIISILFLTEIYYVILSRISSSRSHFI